MHMFVYIDKQSTGGGVIWSQDVIAAYSCGDNVNPQW